MIPHEGPDIFLADKMLIATDRDIPMLLRQQAVEDAKVYLAACEESIALTEIKV
jgi:hypothetical protein